ncbi:MAG: YbdK family carboxylate-amine ligase [Actinobacteria bacterium]|nr:MAG: YbdK family carboxylate-amine ligase [Actinomycetota bacterium]
MRSAREAFEDGQDFTIAVEEEFMLLDSETLELTNRFEELKTAAAGSELDEHVVGELIASEIEIKTGRCATFPEVAELMAVRRAQLAELADRFDVALACTGTHPWSRWQDQRIIDTPHYRRNNEILQYVVWRNNSFGVHAHIGIRGADRAIAVCNAFRNVLPELLALSASSPFVEDAVTGLHSARTEIFTKMFPRCGIPDVYAGWAEFEQYVRFLYDTRSIDEHTQLWWSVRPHHSFGTVEVRICDAQTRGDDSFALAGLIAACIAQTALDFDEHGYDGKGTPLADREIEENLWRAIRYGAGGRMIDWHRGEEVPTRSLLEQVVVWTEPARTQLGIDVTLPERNGAQRAREALDSGVSIEDIYRDAVAETRRTYAGAGHASERA